ncbi:MFS transporter [Streptomyces melanosporofaciens]|uniref:Drug resistance transporter, EmrB/QacA subfamily n=1 Tax=Streptomyces melanosporofaciens TaxID=67327 RepID=A0A1H4UY35_STRMJ|nr:MFS transporter [Streptomyces melanosporofaciens]SEC73782.1 drug resistance transporter, EmrB/QacA subfamily [Streptomyces melanosporofaciens]
MTTPSPKAQGSGVPAATPGPAPATAPDAAAPAPSRRRWLILAVASAAQFLAVLDMIAVNIAFPAIGADFRSASTAELSWVLNAYTIVLAALLVPAGRLADAIGGRRSFLTGIALFGLASVACGAAPGLGTLIAARVVQGVAAAVLVPTSLSLALPAFPPRERATAVGVWTAVSAVAASAGPVAGGLLAASDWRWIFLVNPPVVLLAWVAGLRLLPRTGPVRTGPVRGERRRLDPLGTLLVLLGTGSLTTACVEAADWGYGAPATLGFLAVGLVMGALAVAHVRRHPDPVVDPALFRTRAFTAATLGLLSYFLAYAASILAATLLFTGAWGWSSARAGLAVTPWPLTVLVVSMLSGRIVRALGERTTAVVGGLCFAAGPVWWLLLAGGDGAHYAVGFMPGLVLTGIGAGLYQPVMFSAAGLLPARQLSLGSGVLMMSRQGGSALGVAALVMITGGAARPGLDALRAGWVFTAVTAALAAVAGAAVRTGVRVDPGENGGSGTDPLRHH